ncbi:MAG: hypothetical protein EBU90_24545 [Proteobacteria bacterium]|nr:hypothetical protein [Pseudomonadota bacterium]
MYVYDSKLIKQDKVKLIEVLLPNEAFKGISFSYNDSNICYITTSLRVIKKLVSRLDTTLGLFTTEQLSFTPEYPVFTTANSTGLYTGFDIHPGIGNYDLIITAKQAGIYVSREPNSFVSTLFNQNIENFSSVKINVKKHEYVQANYINTELYKIIKNALLLTNQIVGRFFVTYPLSGNSVFLLSSYALNTNAVLNGYTYLPNYNFLTIGNTMDYFLHENERVSPLAINRCITNIYQLIQQLFQNSLPIASSLISYPTSASGTLFLT